MIETELIDNGLFLAPASGNYYFPLRLGVKRAVSCCEAASASCQVDSTLLYLSYISGDSRIYLYMNQVFGSSALQRRSTESTEAYLATLLVISLLMKLFSP